MNHWASLIGEVKPPLCAGLPSRKHILADEEAPTVAIPEAAPVLANASIPLVAGKELQAKRVRAPAVRRKPGAKMAPANPWPLLSAASAADIRKATSTAWALIGSRE